jgi:hypothetical protein
MKVIRVGIILGAAAAAGLTGCQSTPWEEDPRRSQYDNYQRIRGDRKDDTTRNRFGGDEVNLRERLKPLDSGSL